MSNSISPTDYKRAYNAKNYERLYPWTLKGKKQFYSKSAKQCNCDSLNDFIITAIEEKMKRDTPNIYDEMQNLINKK